MARRRRTSKRIYHRDALGRVRLSAWSVNTGPQSQAPPTCRGGGFDGRRCRDAAKFDQNRRATLTRCRRVAGGCQSRLHGRLRDSVDALADD